MLFEVINDRGMALKPYEILKGKLIGCIDHGEARNEAVELWENGITQVIDLKPDSGIENGADQFFYDWLRAKHADDRKSNNIDKNKYHRQIFESPLKEILMLHEEVSAINFLEKDFTYFTKVRKKLDNLIQNLNTSKPKFEFLYYNGLNGRGLQTIVIISSLLVDDLLEDEKIGNLAFEVDRFYNILLMQSAYDSNRATDRIYAISREVREHAPESYRDIFNRHLVEELRFHNPNTDFTERNLLKWGAFQKFGGYTGQAEAVTKYFLSRVEEYLGAHLKVEVPSVRDICLKGRGKQQDLFSLVNLLDFNSTNTRDAFGGEMQLQNEMERIGALLIVPVADKGLFDPVLPLQKRLVEMENPSQLISTKIVGPKIYEAYPELNEITYLDTNIPLRSVSKNLTNKFILEPKDINDRQIYFYHLARAIWEA